MVLRCDGCVTCHVIRRKEEGVTDAEFFECFNVGLMVGAAGVLDRLSPHFYNTPDENRILIEAPRECRFTRGRVQTVFPDLVPEVPGNATTFPFRNTETFPIGNVIPLDDAGESG